MHDGRSDSVLTEFVGEALLAHHTSRDTYKRVTPCIVEALRQIVGPEDVFFGSGDGERLEPYAHDESVALSLSRWFLS